jgi:DNA cross-link repair 1A protein
LFSPLFGFSFESLVSTLTNNYFLTHFHSDHYGGITSSWNAGVIYCSIATAALVNQQLRVDKKYIHPLPMDVPVIIASRGKPITVTLLDANHCPGAIMFLFQVGKRHILHVGDFRWNRNVMLNQAPLKAFALGKIQLDELFLDTTYCDPKYTLPTQDKAIRETVTVVRKEIQSAQENKCRTLHIFGAYTIGKERIYLAVAEQLGLKIYVDNTRFKILSAFQWPKERMALLTTRKEDTNLWVVPLGHINMKKMPEYLNSKQRYDRIIGYRPTGWSMKASPSGGIISSRSSGNLSIYGVPYSEHSAFNELLDCLQCLRPQKIIPTVNASKSREQVDLLLTALRQKQTILPYGAKGSPQEP